ncbi:unnamed protein product, partial [Rotaria sordida]
MPRVLMDVSEISLKTTILGKIVPQADKKGYRAIVITCDQPHERIRDFVLPLFEEASKNVDPELMKNMSIPNLN